MKPNFAIELLSRRHNRDNFDCGEESLNEFLRKYARQNNEKGFGRTFVAVLSGKTEVVGYYTISSGSISFEVVPLKMPHYPIPVIHLGRLAVDSKMHGQRLGEILLINALERTVLIAEQTGVYAMELYALTDNAKRFYLKYGFVELNDDEKHLYLPIETLKKSGLIG